MQEIIITKRDPSQIKQISLGFLCGDELIDLQRTKELYRTNSVYRALCDKNLTNHYKYN